MKINLHHCFVCESTGYMLGLDTPDEVYYFGPTDEDCAKAKAAAEAEAAEGRKTYPGLTFLVMDLGEYLRQKADNDRAEGERNASW